MDDTSPNAMGKLLAFLEQLEAVKIWYRLGRVREAIMVEVAVAGGRWEIEFFADGQVEVERFISTGKIEGEEAIAELFAKYSD